MLGVLSLGVGAHAQSSREHWAKVEEALESSDLKGAQQALDEAAAGLPEGAPPRLFFQGRLAFEAGRYAEAVELLQRAGVEDKPGSLLQLARDTQRITKNDAHQESAHFIVFYPPGKDELLVPYALETLETQYEKLRDALGTAPPGKMRVEILNDTDELATVSTLTPKEIETTNTIAICKFTKLVVTSPKATLTGYDWRDTLAHELTHFFVTYKSHNTVPIWLQEGLAKHFESAWRGAEGQAVAPAQKAFLADRLRKNQLVTFAQMHPSIAMLPNWEDAYTAMAEVAYAVDYIKQKKGAAGLRAVIDAMGEGLNDSQALERAMGQDMAQFEKGWTAFMKAQPLPKELIPATGEKVALKKEGSEGKAKAPEKPKEDEENAEFHDFKDVTEPKARQFAHLGSLLHERKHNGGAAEELSKAYALVGDKYEDVSHTYAQALMAVRRNDEAERVLQGSLTLHPGAVRTQSSLGRLYLFSREWAKAKDAYLAALGVDPFDPLTQLGLVRAADELKDKTLGERARHAASVLTHASPEEVNRWAKQLASQ
jgi:tetratricopeptide (TPR) repeat protein